MGRLDKDSEGLLLLSNDGQLKNHLLDPNQGHQRSYLVQVDGQINEEALNALSEGVDIRINKKVYHTRPATAQLLPQAPLLPERDPPVRYRATIPTSWIQLTLTEGKNRQVRRMTAKVGYPTLRLVRAQIESISISDLAVGEIQEIDAKDIRRLLNL